MDGNRRITQALLRKETQPLPLDFSRRRPSVADALRGEGEIRNLPSRPRDYLSPVAEALSPTLGGYGLGAMGAETAMRASEGDYSGAAETGIPMVLGMFAGPGAKTANMGMLARAQEMAGRGLHREQIWKDTGWFQRQDGRWRFEIDDSAASLKQSPQQFYDAETAKYGHQTQETWLPNMLEHENVFAAYPKLETGRLFVGDQSHGTASRGTRGAYLGEDYDGNQLFGMGVKAEKDTLLHELQHGIQKTEGFARGSSLDPRLTSDQRSAAIDDYMRVFRAADEANGVPWRETWEKASKWIDSPEGRRLMYERHAGEVESRNVQVRMGMTPEERRNTPPWSTEDTPADQQIVRFWK
jgi:hypothetical protein